MLRRSLLQTSLRLFLLIASLLSRGAIHAQPSDLSPRNATDHGPIATATISSGPQSVRSVFGHQGIPVNGGTDRDAFVVFDIDLLHIAGDHVAPPPAHSLRHVANLHAHRTAGHFTMMQDRLIVER